MASGFPVVPGDRRGPRSVLPHPTVDDEIRQAIVAPTEETAIGSIGEPGDIVADVPIQASDTSRFVTGR